MKCPVCEGEIKGIDLKYCEFCGTELFNIDHSDKKRIDVRSTHFKKKF